MATPEQYEARADSIADTLRTFLVAIHTGGLGVIFAIAGALASECVAPAWAACPALVFSAGLTLAGISLLLAKHKALKRRDAARAGQPIPEFKEVYWRNFTWDAVTLALFMAGVLYGLHQLGTLEVAGCLPSG